MPIISQFYGIIVKMFFNDKEKHHLEHIHVNGNILAGNLPKKQKCMVEAWIEIHNEELKALWRTINEDNEYFKIEPLK